MKILIVFLILLPFFSTITAAEDVGSNFILSLRRAGRVKVGMSVDDLFKTFRRDSTRLIDRRLEGHFSPWIEIYIEDSDRDQPSLIAEIRYRGNRGWHIGRISVADQRFKTDKGIGIGSTLGEIRKAYKVDRIGTGEGVYLNAVVREIGLTFGLNSKFYDLPSEWQKTQKQSLVPDAAKVVSILVYDLP